MIHLWQARLAIPFAAFSLLASAAPAVWAQNFDSSTVVRGVDASVRNRLDRLASYTVTEHYAVFRGHDESKPAAEMLVKTTYRKESGKSYEILSQSGSSLWRNEVLKTLLENEQRMSEPGNVETALINSSNYEMKLAKNTHAQDHLVARYSHELVGRDGNAGVFYRDAPHFQCFERIGIHTDFPAKTVARLEFQVRRIFRDA